VSFLLCTGYLGRKIWSEQTRGGPLEGCEEGICKCPGRGGHDLAQVDQISIGRIMRNLRISVPYLAFINAFAQNSIVRHGRLSTHIKPWMSLRGHALAMTHTNNLFRISGLTLSLSFLNMIRASSLIILVGIPSILDLPAHYDYPLRWLNRFHCVIL